MRYRSLQTVESAPAAPSCAREGCEYPTLDKTDPADRVMVDFCRECAVTVEPHQYLDAALKQMQRAGVTALLVIANGRISGLITAYDIRGEKPIRFVQRPNCIHHPQCRHEDVEDADVNAAISPRRASREAYRHEA